MQQPVRLYSLSTCIHCKAAKKLLSTCGVEYEFTDVDLLDREERKAFNPDCSFPTIIIGDRVLVGYKEKEILEALGLEDEPPGTILLRRLLCKIRRCV